MARHRAESWLARRCRESEVQIPDADPARCDEVQAGVFQQRYDFRNIHVTVSVAQVPAEASSLPLRLGKVDEERPATGLENPSQLRRKLSTGGAAEVMKHHGAKSQIEARARKRERLGGAILESNLDARLGRLRARPGQHFRGGINAADQAGTANRFLRENRKGAGTTSHIEHRFAGLQARQLEKPPAQLLLAPPQSEPYDCIVERRGVQDSANRPRHCVLTRHGLSFENGHLSDFECRLIRHAEEERNREFVRYRTLAPTLSGSGTRNAQRAGPVADRRIQRTRALLHEALGSLIREKPYDRITVAEILDRAQVSRSTFYIHFKDKDELLASSMRALLLGVLSAGDEARPDAAERMVAFSLPLLTHIHQHRRSGKVKLGERGRGILHEHLRRALSEWIVETMAGDLPTHRSRRSITPELLARHVASTFVLVLHWWLDDGAMRSPREADELFRALVMPVLRSPYP